MSAQDDISWSTLRRIARDWAGDAAEVESARPLDGGSINTTLLLTTTAGDKAVLKISPHRVNTEYRREAHQLDLLRELGLPTPKVYQIHTADLDRPDSFMLMEYVDGVDLHAAQAQCTPDEFDGLQRELADACVKLHGTTREQYGRVCQDNEQPTFDRWGEFYRHVYDPVLGECDKLHVIPAKTRKHIQKLHERIDRYIAHGDRPRLVHWDLWSNNVLAARNGDGRWHLKAILDPMCKFAHAEAELAYMDLFKTCTPAFKQQYQQTFKLTDDYHRIRKPIYQLYPLLNHVQLFGAEYMKPLMDVMAKVEKLI
jgi:fructosamine-3-kinase